MGRLFDFILDIIIGTMSVISRFPGIIAYFPYTISPVYHWRRIWFPYRFETIKKNDYSDLYHYDPEKILWLDENVGKYRWRIIKRKGFNESNFFRKTEYNLCFRHKTDAMAYKLKWVE